MISTETAQAMATTALGTTFNESTIAEIHHVHYPDETITETLLNWNVERCPNCD